MILPCDDLMTHHHRAGLCNAEIGLTSTRGVRSP
jgi:hypothetical protein